MSIRLLRATRGLWKKIATSVLASTMLAGAFSAIIVTAAAQPAAAALSDFNPVTYNMQGGGANKWINDVPQLLRHHDVLALQEAGADPPGSAILEQTTGYLGSDTAQWAGWRVRRYHWISNRNVFHIYWLRLDFSAANRMNIAIITSRAVDEALVASPAFYANNGLPTSRPALGLRMAGGTYFWSLHALSGSGNDVARLVTNIRTLSGTRIWAAMGDYNRDPGSISFGRGIHTYTSGASTQRSGGELDYMVSNERIAGYGGVVLNAMSSDHFPVAFRGLAANADIHIYNAHDSNRAVRVDNNNVLGSGITNDRSWNTSLRLRRTASGFFNVYNAKTSTCWRNEGYLIRGRVCNANDTQQHIGLRAVPDTNQIQMYFEGKGVCIGDDPDWGWDTEVISTQTCNTVNSRFNAHLDRDPGAGAAGLAIY